ncbi:hypothetical protein BJ875DRAFT_447474 [Amylocarpus encephaloides]|uniref:Uncharacterized protein n=1 Tax=Amylocarpus encephaloides TaxID=45428 RepID=A0A9P7YTJ4_9HELO|nr:hypothetical protein BJ875DRAFT_447474 [Amylocarpus encephaloides]
MQVASSEAVQPTHRPFSKTGENMSHVPWCISPYLEPLQAQPLPSLPLVLRPGTKSFSFRTVYHSKRSSTLVYSHLLWSALVLTLVDRPEEQYAGRLLRRSRQVTYRRRLLLRSPRSRRQTRWSWFTRAVAVSTDGTRTGANKEHRSIGETGGVRSTYCTVLPGIGIFRPQQLSSHESSSRRLEACCTGNPLETKNIDGGIHHTTYVL